MKPSRNGETTLLFNDVGKSLNSHEYFTPQICLLTLFAKAKYSRKVENLLYMSDKVMLKDNNLV